MKILFLDFDGVLNCKDDFLGTLGKVRDVINPIFRFRLNEIVQATGAQIVVSSAWRQSHTIPELQRFCGQKVIDKTPIDGQGRGEQIKLWLKENDFVEHYVVIDDDAFDIVDVIPEGNFVHTSFEHGLTEEKKLETIMKLNFK
jgi:hypothetical protein